VSFSVIGLDHVNVTTPEELEAQVLEWYEGRLGLERIPRPEGSTKEHGGWYRLGDGELHIGLEEHNPPKSAHFALVVDDLDAIIDQLRETGCHIEQARPIAGRRRFFTRDPAGNRIEVMVYDDSEAIR
jgi:catechol 2,3-dioxygenase-like lactoylglutathione lyase family enzyme